MRLKHAISMFFGVFLCFASSLVLAADGELPLANSIDAMWSLSLQPCNGGGANAMQRHPDQATVQDTKVVPLPTLGLKFRIPQLPDVKSTHLKLFFGDRSRGVIDNYLLLAEYDLAPPFAALVVTQLPPQFDTSEKVFSAVDMLERQLARKAGVTPSFERLQGPYGDSIEMIVENRVGTHCYPTSDFQFLPLDSDTKTIGISRFAFTTNKLAEFAIVVRIPKHMKSEEAKAYARKIMDGYWLGLKPI